MLYSEYIVGGFFKCFYFDYSTCVVVDMLVSIASLACVTLVCTLPLPLSCSSRCLSAWGARRPLRRRARDAMVDRWSYASNVSWVPGENIPALQRGGFNGGASINAAGMQLFGNCVTNLGRLPRETLLELYSTLSGKEKPHLKILLTQ